MRKADNNYDHVALSDLLPRRHYVKLWHSFARECPDRFQRILDYDGADQEWVTAMRGWVIVYVLGKLECGKIQTHSDKLIALQANAIGSSVINIGISLRPELKWLRY